MSLRRHIPAIAVDWELATPAQRSRQIDGTLVFADISGFTALSERLAQRGRIGAEELVETLSRVFGAMLETAAGRGGVLLKFGGDALLFLFEGASHARQACCAAVEMRSALREAQAVPTSVGRLALSMSVGVHTGPVDLFLVGAPHRELVVLGPAATAVTEAEGAAQPGEILLSAGGAEALGLRFSRDRGDGRRVLRWAKAPDPPTGRRHEEPVDRNVLVRLFPRTLGSVLELGPPDPEHRVATIAFIRFSGTDALLAEGGPNAVAHALDETLRVVEEAFLAEGVTLLAVDVDKDGGKVFAGSGVPHASEDDESSMLRALRAILDSGCPLPLQAGVNRGHVFAAEVGTLSRAAYSAMGDTTNTAARICAKAPPGHLYAHPAVLEHANHLFQTELAGPFEFKGKAVPQVVYDIGSEVGPRRPHGNDERPLLGRETELATARAAVAAVASGAGGVLTIVGVTGMGKSRLMRQALSELSSSAIVPVRAEPYGSTSPYRMFRDRVRELLGVERGDPATMSDSLLRGVEALDASLVPLAPLIAEVAHVEVPTTPEADAIDPQFRPDRTADVAIALLEAGLQGPMVLIAEDAHWADEASSLLLGKLADACRSHPWLLVVARRGTERGFTPQSGETIELVPLDDDTITAMIIDATQTTPLRPHEIDGLVARAGGNPLFVEELVRAIREVGSLEAVPESLNAAMAAQVDALDPVARRILSYASVLGRSFRRRTLDAVLEREELVLDPATAERLQAFFDPEGNERLRFRNALIRDVAYEGLAYSVRTRLHREAGEVLETMSTDVEADADTLSGHFWRAQDHARTWRYARLAAQRSERAFANTDAATHYQRALEAARRLPDIGDGERAEVWTRLGDVSEVAGLFDGALDAFRRASRLTRDPVGRAELFLKRARARERAGSFSNALRELAFGRRELEGVDTPEAGVMRARLASFGAMVRFGQERFSDARTRAENAVELARRAGARAGLAEALAALEISLLYLGTPADGRYLREAVAIYRELGERRMAARSENNLGNVLFHIGRWAEAVEHLERARAEIVRLGDMAGAATTASNLGEILLMSGHLGEAEPFLREAVRVLRSIGYVDGAAYAEIQLGRLLVETDRLDEAERLLTRTIAEFEALGQLSSVLEAMVADAERLIRLGRADEALARLAKGEARAGTEADLIGPRLAYVRGMALAQLGRFAELEPVIAAGVDTAREQGLAFDEALLVIFQADHAAQIGVEVDATALDRAQTMLAGLRGAASATS